MRKPEININVYYSLDVKEADRVLYYFPSRKELAVCIETNFRSIGIH